MGVINNTKGILDILLGYQTPIVNTRPGSLSAVHEQTRQPVSLNLLKKSGNSIIGLGVNSATDYLSGLASNKLFDDSEFGRGFGTLFSSGLSSAGNTITDNIVKGTTLTEGLGKNVGNSLAGTAAGLAANYIGQGINSLGGNTMLSRGIGQGVATGLGTVGGVAALNLINNGSVGKIFGKAAGSINPYGLAMTVVGSGLGAAMGPSKEYGGEYGNTTKIMDTAYDAVMAGVNFIPGWGLIASGAMALNKGLSNIFGSTDGMTVLDAILGSAFMPAPVKWLNMAGSNTTSSFNKLSWQNSEKANTFMGNAFGDLGDKFDLARKESGKTYGTFSQSAYRDALKNINFANNAWNLILAMADLNEYQNIRSLYMSSINNQRYAQNILGGWTPLARGKYGMKILNNATNHNIGMRLLSGAALIDNKAMILSAQTGTKVTRPPRMRAHRKGDKSRGLTPEEQEWWKLHEEEQKRQLEEETTRKIKEKEEAADKFNQQASTVIGAMTQQANETPFTGQEYQQAAENLRLEKVEKFHEAEKVGEAALMADLAVSATPLLLRGFRWAFNKSGLLVKVPINKFTTAKSVYNEGNMSDLEIYKASGDGFKEAIVAYKPGGVWYERQIANGVPKEEVDRLASEYLNSLNNTSIAIDRSTLSDAVAVALPRIEGGNIKSTLIMDPRYTKNYALTKEAATHEAGHASTKNIEPINSDHRMSEAERYYKLAEESSPETKKAMEYNESIRPEVKESALDEILSDETAMEHFKNVDPLLEIRQRAFAAELDAANKNVTMDKYINNPNLWNLNFKLLAEIYDMETLKHYMKHYKTIVSPLLVGGSTAATLYNKSK